MDASARLLGRNLRSVDLARALADHPDPRVSSKGLGCLALIGAGDDMKSRAYPAIRDPGTSFEVIQASLWALLLVRRIDLERLRDAVAGHGQGEVLRAAQVAAWAANSGRWLLPQ